MSERPAPAAVCRGCCRDAFWIDRFGPASAAAEAPLIGVVQLVDHEALNDSVRGITDGLKARGLAGSLDLQNAHGDQSTLKTIGDRFVHKDAKLIFAVATPAVQAMARATKTIPIVGAAVTSYTAAKVIASNEHPGGNVTGVSNIGPVAAQLDLFMKLVPNAKRVGTIYNAGEINSVVQIELLRAAAKARGIELEEATVTNLTDLQSAVVSMSKKSTASSSRPTTSWSPAWRSFCAQQCRLIRSPYRGIWGHLPPAARRR